MDGSSFETVTYPDDQIMLRVTDGDIPVVEYSSTDRDGRYTAADLVDTAGRFGVTLG